jgi:FkbM family methyltransferase
MHRIPFGPNRGRLIYCSITISPRMYFGVDERWVASLAREHVAPGDVVYDIGAHVGYTTLLFAPQAGHVHAFELVPSVADEFLARTVAANALTNVTIHRVGLSDEDRVVELPVSQTMMASLDRIRQGVRIERCHLVPLDSYAVEQHLPPPSLIKIDVEGAEVHCLRGARELIRRHRPVLVVEFHSRDLLTQGVTLLESLGYRISRRQKAALTFPESMLCVPS